MDDYEVIIPSDPVTARVRDLVILALASKEVYMVNAAANEHLNTAMELVLEDLKSVIHPTVQAELHVMPGGKH